MEVYGLTYIVKKYLCLALVASLCIDIRFDLKASLSEISIVSFGP